MVITNPAQLGRLAAGGAAAGCWCGLVWYGMGAVDVALDGGAGWFKLGASDYDVVVLDRDLPMMPADELCRRLRAQGSGTRVLMLTAASGAAPGGEGPWAGRG